MRSVPSRNGHSAIRAAGPVARALPVRGRRMVGPWCFLDRFGPMTFAEGKPMDVAPHPHIGLQTVTWLLDGEIVHDDSLGCEAVARPGGVNVMTAGRGIAHTEQTPERNSGRLEGVQLWVALPEPVRNGASSFVAVEEVPIVEQAGGLARYHAWAFATTRQMGAAMELLAAELWWLQEFAAPGSATHAALQRAASAFLRLSQGCKSFILKGARGVSTGRPLDVTLLFDDMATAWEEGMAALQAALRGGLDAPPATVPTASASQGAGGHPDGAKGGHGGHQRHDELAADLPLLVVRS